MGRKQSSPLKIVPYVDLSRYIGVWYEIARYQNSFQEGCVGSRATYTLIDGGNISVLNECYDKAFDGKLRSAKGKAWVIDKGTNAKLKVSFFWLFAETTGLLILARITNMQLLDIQENIPVDSQPYKGNGCSGV